MIGMVFGSVGTPFWPWHAAHACAFASISSAAPAGTAATAKPSPAPKIVEKRRVDIATFLPPVTAHGTQQTQVSRQRAQGAIGRAGAPRPIRRRHNQPDMLGLSLIPGENWRD